MTEGSTDGDVGTPGSFAAGDRLLADGRVREAEAAYERAAEAGDGVASGKLGVLREHRGDTDGARRAYEAGDEAGDGFATLHLGLLLAAADEWEAAEAAFARAAERGQDPEGLDPVKALRETDGRPAPAPAERTANPALANPVLVGALAVLLLMVGVFLAYNANNGLPFVPTKELKVDIASGSDLVPGNEVREGGFRVGLVSELNPIELKTGQIGAQLILQLDQAHGNVPVDSTASIRPRSVLGLKYIDLHTGTLAQVVRRRRDDADHADERAGPVRGCLPGV